jgi:putative addiction module component (TIGR02574 family)
MACDLERVKMARKFKEVESDAMQLSPRERALLVERLLTTLDPGEDVDAEELWLQEAERRYQGYRAGGIGSKPAEQVFEDANKRLICSHPHPATPRVLGRSSIGL